MEHTVRTSITTPNVADACLRLGIPFWCAPSAIRPLVAGTPIEGPAIPVTHHGSVDVFLEALGSAQPGSILVVDNQGRTDEACIGDLVTLEVKSAGLAGIVIWGAHRDSAEIREIGLPVYSTGTWPCGPIRLDDRGPDTFQAARVGERMVTSNDYLFADDDGIVFIAKGFVGDVIAAAGDIHVKETAQAQGVRAGRSLREQFDFSGFLRAQEINPRLTFREHLIGHAAEIEVDWT